MKPVEYFHASRLGWRKRVVLGVAVLLCAGAVTLQYYLIKRFSVVKVEAAGRFTPATARLGQESLVVVKDPVLAADPNDYSAEDLLLSHEGIENGVVDVHFDRAQLSQETVALLAGAGVNPPLTHEEVDYAVDTGRKPEPGEPCRTLVRILRKALPKQAAELHFFQMGTPGSRFNRHLEMKAGGVELAVSMSAATSPEGDPQAPGCQKVLRIGDWKQRLGGSIPIKVIAAPDSGFRFYFKSLNQNVSLWEGPSGLFEPFVLGTPPMHPGDLPSLQARAVEIRSFQERSKSAPSPILSARSPNGEAPLNVQSLSLGSNQLQAMISGRGRVAGKDITWADRLKMAPMLAVSLAAANAGLILLLRLLFKLRSAASVKREVPAAHPALATVATAPDAEAVEAVEAEVFISYAREDQPMAKILARALEQQRWSVWWDQKIRLGEAFDEMIEKALAATSCVIVLWSTDSVSSRWVRAEASVGAKREILLPVLIADVQPPLEFSHIQTARLADWQGESSHPEFEKLLEAVSTLLRRATEPKTGTGGGPS